MSARVASPASPAYGVLRQLTPVTAADTSSSHEFLLHGRTRVGESSNPAVGIVANLPWKQHHDLHLLDNGNIFTRQARDRSSNFNPEDENGAAGSMTVRSENGNAGQGR